VKTPPGHKTLSIVKKINAAVKDKNIFLQFTFKFLKYIITGSKNYFG